MGLTEEEYAQLLRNRPSAAQAAPGSTPAAPAKKRGKYGNKAVLLDLGPSGEVVGGKLRLVHTFDSQREADYYQTLRLRRQAGEIADLELQRSFALLAHVQALTAPAICGYYEADFVFFEHSEGAGRAGRTRVIDVKGMKTQVYALKKKIVEACWGITIEEV